MQSNLKQIYSKKEYIDSRLKLENTFILFFAYSDEDSNWIDILETLQEEFNKTLQVILFSNKSEEKLINVLLDEGETIPDINYPRAVICHPHLTEPQLLKDFEPYDLLKTVEDCHDFYINRFESEKKSVFEKIKKILTSFPVIVFIKGSPHDPYCKYSKSFIEILKSTGIRYKSFDIFRDDSLRSYLRLFSGWKTYPQIYISGKIIGGLDVLKDLVEKSEFMKLIPRECTKEYTKESCLNLIQNNKDKILIFGKGDYFNNKVQCKSSKEAYEILTKFKDLQFEIVDVMKDEMLRSVVKEISGYNYYPQLFYQGKFLGGLKFLKDNKLSELIHNK
jgi:Grx4 family monothiol glutaredoxin